MPNSNDQPEFADMDEAEVVVLDERDAVGPAIRTRRPLTGRALEEARAFLAKRAELQRLNGEYREKLDAENDAEGGETK